jgi:predicted  nucleic acid-binding Zn-ribbon protein
MNSVAHISTKNRDEARAKVQLKLDALKKYAESGEASFELPAKFTLNWFATLEEVNAGFQRVSKGSVLLKTGGSTHAMVTAALTAAQHRWDDGRSMSPTTTISGIKNEIKKLKRENTDLKHRIKGLVKNTVQLLEELEYYKGKLGVEQARWQDTKE